MFLKALQLETWKRFNLEGGLTLTAPLSLSLSADSSPVMQHYGVNGYSLHAMNSLSAMYNLHQQAAQQAQHAPDYRPSVHALTLAERLAGKNQ